ncbi:hypothetical protein Tsubulata_006815 [Turnera subulata]|uniref:DUF4283 domain-containing protein n=1 Tax=Turnera subulata TaxID=218843 RepID=A0A9Q0F9T7_9ROSI|nr:hypothetical protein Tsubulata_006815 [Turnera subulata]
MASPLYNANGEPCSKSSLVIDLGRIILPKPNPITASRPKANPSTASSTTPIAFVSSTSASSTVAPEFSAVTDMVDVVPPPVIPNTGTSQATLQPSAAPSTTWAKVVSSPLISPQLQFVEPIYSADNSVVCIPPELIDLGRQKYSLCLIGQFMGTAPKLGFIHAILNKLWGRDGTISVSPYKDGLFLFQFPNAQVLSRALYRGPWHVGGVPLMLWPWSSTAQKMDFSAAIFPVWVKLNHVPLELLTKEGLSYLASAIGTPLHADQDCSKLFRGDSANVCILVDFSKPLKHTLAIDFNGVTVAIDVTYSYQPQRCGFCKEWGHHELACGKKKMTTKWVPKTTSVVDATCSTASNPVNSIDIANVNPVAMPVALNITANSIDVAPIHSAAAAPVLKATANSVTTTSSVPHQVSVSKSDEPSAMAPHNFAEALISQYGTNRSHANRTTWFDSADVAAFLNDLISTVRHRSLLASAHQSAMVCFTRSDDLFEKGVFQLTEHGGESYEPTRWYGANSLDSEESDVAVALPLTEQGREIGGWRWRRIPVDP